ncbi:MAG: pyridoxal-phosphate dependent enzyme [Xanthomonadales bacterium]|nr:pyridoxal-phosphate dependent enzyme [Gammaproteobacteria bacterium]NND58278.1 pyridoxal-phosphate dependent enzyme [Xanthomonadales bacterium]NNK52011.1 pyridoxal-phosphate dependent enzyme [Xanthomonadales bacterium]NNL96102.1 pyridoxal-phosphate dependent enzyme [Xanthomonadales bacterium]
MATYFNSILETIGNTPIVKINRLAPPGIDLFVKIESFNPMGSVKDRMALSVIQQAERDGVLKPGQTVVEATSGNTGIGLAMVCAAKGYPLVLTMAENFSVERRKILRFLGAKVVLTPAELKGSGMLAKAEELAETHGWFLVRQFENEANAEAHTLSTALEILDVFRARSLNFFVTGYGTGGTLKGTARVLKQRSPETRIVVCEPDNSPLLGSGVPQARDQDGNPSESHPHFRPHLMQGWTPDFIPKLAEDAVAMKLIDQIMPVDGAHSLEMSRQLACMEGIFTGTSGGATFSGAMQLAKNAPPNTTILCMLPDTGERYLSTPLFEGIREEMTEEEMDIARSTPGYRFDNKAAAPAPEKAGDAPPLDESADKFVTGIIGDKDTPVVLFALEWCEFCWAIRKLFAELDIPYNAVDLDSVKYQKGDFGGQIRAVLAARIGSNTIPQIFIGGEHLGGATDTFEACKSGELQQRLANAGIDSGDLGDKDPYELLPKWLHKR